MYLVLFSWWHQVVHLHWKSLNLRVAVTMAPSSTRIILLNVKKVSCLEQIQVEKNIDKFIISSLFCRSLPEPLMTYELHGEFIIPASKYMTIVHVENYSYSTVVALGACCKSNSRKILQLSKNIGIRNNKSFKNTEVLTSVQLSNVSHMVYLLTDNLVID